MEERKSMTTLKNDDKEILEIKKVILIFDNYINYQKKEELDEKKKKYNNLLFELSSLKEQLEIIKLRAEKYSN